MPTYKIDKKYFGECYRHIKKRQCLKILMLDSDGNIMIEYIDHKGYTGNDTGSSLHLGVKAISMFSGAGGLDIGTQLAGVK